jgi:hypothetical protein
MPQLANRNSSNAASGGGYAEQAGQQRMSQSNGISHARTARSRRGQRQRIGKRAR